MTQEQHVQFWNDLAGCVRGTRSIEAALDMLVAKRSKAYPEDVVSVLRQAVHGETTLGQAMWIAQDVWPAMVVAIIRAAEFNGTVDLAAARISEAVAEGALLRLPESTEQPVALAWFWRGFGHMLAAGVPVGQVLETLGVETSHAKLREACRAIKEAVMGRQRLVGAMRQYPDLFPAKVQTLIAAGEEAGTLDTAALEAARATTPGPVKAPSVDLSIMPEPMADKMVTCILLQAIKDHASDVHFQPEPGGSLLVRYRIDGVLYEMQPLPADLAPTVLARLKVMANLDVGTRNAPQDGRILVTAGEQRIDLRINVLPTLGGERIVVRLIRRVPDLAFEFGQIGLSGKNLERMKALCGLPRGLVLVTGPAGSGVTTTVYSMVRHLDKPDRAIITIEDPVEWCDFSSVSQVQVSPATGLTFAAAIRSAMRQSPNILVSEIRDQETALLLMQAALTGHLVIGSLGGDGALAAIWRMLDLGVEPFMVSTTLRGVISQRVIRRVCSKCRVPDDLSHLEEATPAIQAFVRTHPDATFHRGRGCENCGHTGYRGRVGVFEIVTVDDALRRAIFASDTTAIQETIAAGGTDSLMGDALQKAADGITSLDEVTRLQADCLV